MRPSNPSLDLKEFSGLDQKQKLVHLIKFALLAPSSHNTQPWQFRLADNAIEILADQKRALPYSDPTGRQLYLSIGTAAANLELAAKYFGYKIKVILNDDNLNDLAATIELMDGGAAGSDEQLAKAMLSRHNNRFPYEEKMPEQQFLDWMAGQSDSDLQVDVVKDAKQKQDVINIVGNATEHSLDDYDFRQELSHWVRPNLNKYADGMPGYNLGMSTLMSFIFPHMVRKVKLGKPQRKMDEKILQATPAFVVISAKQDSKLSWLKTGMLFERIALQAEVKGLKIGVSAAVIEAGHFYKDLQNLLGVQLRPLMFFRLGYCAKVPKASPRLNSDQVIVA